MYVLELNKRKEDPISFLSFRKRQKTLKPMLYKKRNSPVFSSSKAQVIGWLDFDKIWTQYQGGLIWFKTQPTRPQLKQIWFSYPNDNSDNLIFNMLYITKLQKWSRSEFFLWSYECIIMLFNFICWIWIWIIFYSLHRYYYLLFHYVTWFLRTMP